MPFWDEVGKNVNDPNVWCVGQSKTGASALEQLDVETVELEADNLQSCNYKYE